MENNMSFAKRIILALAMFLILFSGRGSGKIIMNHKQQGLMEKSLWIGPGAETLGKSEVKTLPGLHASPICKVPPHPQTSLQGSVAQLINNNVFHVCGGLVTVAGSQIDKHSLLFSTMLNTCYNYTAGETKWIPAKPMNYHRWGAASVQLDDHSFWVTGGYNNTILKSTEVWREGVWKNSIDLPIALEFHCLVQINATHTFLSGGWTNTGGTFGSVSNATWIYGNGKFTKLKDIPIKRFTHSCSILGNQIWVVGGQQNFSSELSSTEIFHLSTETWTNGPDLPVPTTGGQLIQTEGTLLFIGGVIGDGKSKTQTKNIFQLDNKKNYQNWIKVAEMETARAHFNAQVWEGCH